MSQIQECQNKIQELYKYSMIDPKAPRLDSITGNTLYIVLSFIGLPGRNTMDAKSLAKIVEVINKVFVGNYIIKAFTLSRNAGTITFEPK